jgi:hypothetical protein
MKTKIYLLFIAVIFFGLGLSGNGWTQNEPVNGYYDPLNDWFVFEWDRPDYGKTTTIYDPPNKVNPVIKAIVVFDPLTNEYTYNYGVANQTGVTQAIDNIVVKYMAPIYDAKAPSEDWYMNRYRGKDAWHWTNYPPGILPGKAESGLSFKSKGLPTIVNSVFLGGKRAIYSPPGDYDTDEVEDSFERVMKTLEDQYKEKFENVTRKTIGPTVPPRIFIPLDFLNTIQPYINESITLGWLIDSTLVSTLHAELNKARSYIEANDPSSAKSALQRFMTALDNSTSTQRTTEAYGLLYYNAQYLKNKLPDTYIPPPPPVLELKPEKATLPIGTIHTLTATLTQDNNPLQDYPVNVKVISGPNEGWILNSKLTDINGQAIFSYTSTKVGTDKLVARVEIIIMQSPKPEGVLVAMNDRDIGSIPLLGNDYKTYLLRCLLLLIY